MTEKRPERIIMLGSTRFAPETFGHRPVGAAASYRRARIQNPSQYLPFREDVPFMHLTS